eukprot:m51a1_g11566 hypothetical protein (288) ;mRNA; f:10927-13855
MFDRDKALQPEDPTRPRQLVVRVVSSSAAGVELYIEGSVLWLSKPPLMLSVTVPVLPPRPREQTEQSPIAEELAEEQPQAPVAAFADTEVAARGEVPVYSYSQNKDTVTLRLVLPDNLHVRVEYELRATREAPRRRVALAWELSVPVDVARCRCTVSELNVCAVLPKRQAAWWEHLGRQTAGSCQPQFRIVVGTATALSLVLAACWYERFFRHPEGVLPGLPWAVFLCHAGLCLLAWFATTDSALHVLNPNQKAANASESTVAEHTTARNCCPVTIGERLLYATDFF